jgi:hypothetical protein
LTLQKYHYPSAASISNPPRNPLAQVKAKRLTKRQAIEDFFSTRLGQKFSSLNLHAQFGSSFRSRVSDINRDLLSTIRILNSVAVQPDGSEASVYWAEVR